MTERIREGDRVRSMDVNYREGVVLSVDGALVRVRFDDGGEETQPAGFYERIPGALAQGEMVPA